MSSGVCIVSIPVQHRTPQSVELYVSRVHTVQEGPTPPLHLAIPVQRVQCEGDDTRYIPTPW